MRIKGQAGRSTSALSFSHGDKLISQGGTKGVPVPGRVQIPQSTEEGFRVCNAVVGQELTEAEKHGYGTDIVFQFFDPRRIFGEEGQEIVERSSGVGSGTGGFLQKIFTHY